MSKGLTELVIIIDKSGSMHGLEEDVVGGFNTLIEEQQKEEGQVVTSVILFDTNSEKVIDRVNIKNIKKLEKNDYRPSGCTALLDTVGNAICETERRLSNLKEERPEHVIFSIMTDGLENSSKEFTYPKIQKLIEEKKTQGWDFLFQAANIDAKSEGTRLGINIEDIEDFKADKVGVKMCFCSMSKGIKNKRIK